MIIAILGLLASGTNPTTLKELELDEIKAYRDIHSFSCVEVFKTNDESPTPDEGLADIEARVRINGHLTSCNTTANGQKFTDFIYDGNVVWMVNHKDRTYSHTLVGNSFDPHDFLPGTADSNLKIGQNLPYLLLYLRYDPAPKLKSIEVVQEGKETYRKVEIVAKSKRGNTLTLTEWFFPDKWILKKATFRTSVGYSADFSASNVSFSDKAPASDYKVDPEILKSYKEVPTPG